MYDSKAREIADGILGNPGLIGMHPQTRADLTYEITSELVAAYEAGKREAESDETSTS
jgi:hypothetical protein